MITQKHFFGLIGFLFVAAWIAFNFGYAVLCLLGAAVFYFASTFLEGGVDLGELQERFSSSTGVGAGTGGAPPVRTTRVR